LDKLQHIDQLLRSAAQEPANAFVFDADWDVIEKKLGRRKNRIFALWFFLALISISLTGSVIYSTRHTTSTDIVTNRIKSANSPEHYKSEFTPPKTQKKTSSATLLHANELGSSTVKKAHNAPHSSKGLNSLFALHRDVSWFDYQDLSNSIFKQATVVSLYDWEIDYSQNLDKLEIANTLELTVAKINAAPNLKTRWEIGPAFTPSLSGRLLSENKNNPNLINPLYKSLVANSESIAFSNSYGVNIHYHSKSNFYISSGLFISQRGEKVDYDYLITNFENRISGVVSSYSELKPSAYEKVEYSGSNSYHFIEIPLNIGYKHAISSKFELRSQIGLSYMALNQSQGKKGDPISLRLNDLTSLNFNTQNIAANVKTGIFYNKKNVALGLEPMFGVNLNTLDQNNSLIKTKPYSCGINLSTNFKIYKK
jgi:hypothetical protein